MEKTYTQNDLKRIVTLAIYMTQLNPKRDAEKMSDFVLKMYEECLTMERDRAKLEE